MIWVTGRNPTLVSHSLRGVARNLKATTLTYLAIVFIPFPIRLNTDNKKGIIFDKLVKYSHF